MMHDVAFCPCPENVEERFIESSMKTPVWGESPADVCRVSETPSMVRKAMPSSRINGAHFLDGGKIFDRVPGVGIHRRGWSRTEPFRMAADEVADPGVNERSAAG